MAMNVSKSTTPLLSSVNMQRMSALSAQSAAAEQTPIQAAPVQTQPVAQNLDIEADKKEDGRIKKILITAGVALAALGGIYALSRKGDSNKVQEALQGAAEEIAQDDKTKEAAAEKIQEIAESAADKLAYEIKKPEISDLKDKDFVGEYSKDFPLETQYNKIRFDIQRDQNTQRRYDEVRLIIEDATSEISAKFGEVQGEIDAIIAKMYDVDEFSRELMKNNCEFFSVNVERAVPQKRYFSIEGNKKEGYSGLDPLLHKEAREEIVDTYLGYQLLSPFELFGKESPIINALREKFTISNEVDNRFIDECISKMTSSQTPTAHGHNSLFHAYELAHLGKIFREAMGVTVK